MTVVDSVLLCSDFEIFDFLVDHGATIPEDFPRRWSAFTKSDIGRNKRKRMFLTRRLSGLYQQRKETNHSWCSFYKRRTYRDLENTSK